MRIRELTFLTFCCVTRHGASFARLSERQSPLRDLKFGCDTAGDIGINSHFTLHPSFIVSRLEARSRGRAVVSRDAATATKAKQHNDQRQNNDNTRNPSQQQQQQQHSDGDANKQNKRPSSDTALSTTQRVSTTTPI